MAFAQRQYQAGRELARFFGHFIDLVALAFADGENDDHNFVAIYPIHQPVPQFAQLDFVTVGHAGESRFRDARFPPCQNDVRHLPL